MVDRLLADELHPGLSIREGRNLLGDPDTEGSGSNSTSGSYQVDGYSLVHMPVTELPSVLARWRTADPYLYVRYENGKLVTATVE